MSKENKLGGFLKEVSCWNWEDFCRAEQDPKYTSNEAMIFALLRACTMEKMEAIKLALGRLDGKLKTPVRVEFPKVYYLYPNAKAPQIAPPVAEKALASGEPVEKAEPEPEEVDLKDLTLRQTLMKMSDFPREVPDAIIEFATQTQQWLQGNAEEPIEKPMVKSVVAAHLLKLAQQRNIDALTEVFDQIDGKLVETIQVLGDDIYITLYAPEAPAGASLNSNGVLQIEATQAQQLWAEKLGREYGK